MLTQELECGPWHTETDTFFFFQIRELIIGSRLTGLACCVGLQRESVISSGIQKMHTLNFVIRGLNRRMFIEILRNASLTNPDGSQQILADPERRLDHVRHT